MSDTDTALVDSLKVLDPERPIREATELLRRREMTRMGWTGRAPAPNGCQSVRGGFSEEGAPRCLAGPPFTQ